MKQNLILYLVIAVLVAGGVGFYAGDQYAARNRAGAGGNFAGRTGRNGGGFFGASGASGMTAVRGQVVKEDNQSLTVQLRDGSSKVVLLGSATFDKTVSASASDVTQGTEVMVIGKTNTDGSVTAQTVQLNPLVRPGMGAQNPTPSSQ